MKRRTDSLLRKLVFFVFANVLIVASALAFGGCVLWHICIGLGMQPNPVVGAIMLLGSCVLATTCATAFNGNIMLKPIYNIKKAMLTIAKGDFNVELDERGYTKEIIEMAGAFNKMVAELKSVEMLREDFVANVSHEFKTPLASIEGYAMLMQDNELSNEERLEYAQIIIDNTKKLSSMTSNILKLSKLERQDFSLSKSSFRLDEQIRQVIVALEDKWGPKEIDLEIDLENIKFNGYEELLGHVWGNLIENAIKFSEQRGCIEIGLKASLIEVIFSIKDHGIGMDESTKCHIYEKFYQGDHSRSTQGNGLGLALVRQVIALSDGEIVVESKLEEGTLFEVHLPKVS